MKGALQFTRYEVADLGSAAVLFKDSAHLVGIYVLELADGAQYVGQTVNIIQRFAAHRRHHGDVLALLFAPCRAEDLDRYEREVIQERQQVVSLRNIMLTDLPGGAGDVTMTVQEGRAALLPWDRARRPTIGQTIDSARRRFHELSAMTVYPDALGVLGQYVSEVVPDPLSTARYLWNVTALPETGRRSTSRRLFTLNCGNLETFYAYELRDDAGGIEFVVRLNVKATDGLTDWIAALDAPERQHPLAQLDFGIDVEPGYRAADSVVAVETGGFATMSQLLQVGPVLDAAYQLAVELMRRGPSMYARHHNAEFVADIVRAAAASGAN